MPSFASIISVLSILFYCTGFLRVELELHEHKKRINTLESIAEAKPPSNDPDITKNPPGVDCNTVQRHIRQVDSTENVTEAKGTAEPILEIKKLLLEMRALQFQPNGVTSSLGPPGPPGPPGPRGHKGARGRRGQKGRTGNKGDKGIMGSAGKSGKQGIAGPAGLKGETGSKGEKGDKGLTGMPGTKGDMGPTGMPGALGYMGPPGKTGTKGDMGPKGVSGTKGDRGAMGMRGSKGNKGTTGMPGAKGDKGTTGMLGSKGNTGAKGDLGNKGDKGSKCIPERRIPTDCSDLLQSGHTQSGLYSVNPDGRGHFTVYCDMRTDGGGWAVFQRRQDGSEDFYRGWNDYKAGFGQLAAEFWLGNDKIHRLTASRPSTLRVELEDWNGVKAYAKYGKFNIGDEQAQYRLEVGSYSGTAGDSLSYHNNMAFSTKERDNDKWSSNCAVRYTGAWWYKHCHESNLNGQYLGNKDDWRGARWFTFRGSLSLTFTEMKLRPSS